MYKSLAYKVDINNIEVTNWMQPQIKHSRFWYDQTRTANLKLPEIGLRFQTIGCNNMYIMPKMYPNVGKWYFELLAARKRSEH